MNLVVTADGSGTFSDVLLEAGRAYSDGLRFSVEDLRVMLTSEKIPLVAGLPDGHRAIGWAEDVYLIGNALAADFRVSPDAVSLFVIGTWRLATEVWVGRLAIRSVMLFCIPVVVGVETL